MANKHRGEIDVEICGEKYTLRPSFEAMVEIEDRLGQSIFMALQRAQQADVPAKTVAVCVLAGANAYRKDRMLPLLSYDAVGAKCFEHGVVKLSLPICQFLATCITGVGDEEDAEERAGNGPAGA